jgi:hypothetical protein
MPKSDWGGAVSGGASGAASGAAIGSVVPVIGTGLGAAAGGVVGFFSGLFGKKKKSKPKKYSTLDPQQQALYNDYVASLRGEGPNADMFNYNPGKANENFEQNVARPAYRNYNENVVPQITGQFRSGGIGNSSYTGEALSRHGRDIQESLNAARTNMHYQNEQQAYQRRINATNQVLNTQTFAYSPPGEKTPSGIDQTLNGLAKVGGDWLADYIKTNGNKAPTPTPAPVSPIQAY